MSSRFTFMPDLNIAVKYGLAINNGYLGPTMRLTPLKQADKELLTFTILGLTYARDMLHEVSSILVDAFIEISEPEFHSPFTSEEGASFAKALIETVAYENAMLGATQENPLPILQKGIGVPAEIVIRLLSDIQCRKVGGLDNVVNSSSYTTKARLAVEQAQKASEFFTLSAHRRAETYRDFHSRMAEKPPETISAPTQVLSSLNGNNALEHVTGVLKISETTVAIDDYEKGLFPDVAKQMEGNERSLQVAADQHHRAAKLVESKKVSVNDDVAIKPKLKPLTFAETLKGLVPPEEPKDFLNEEALEQQAIHETETQPTQTLKEKETDMYSNASQATQVFDELHRRPIMMQNGQPLMLNAHEAPKVPVTHAMTQSGPEYLPNGLPVLLFNDSYNGQPSWVHWSPEIESQWLDFGHRNGYLRSGQPQVQSQAQPMGYRAQQAAGRAPQPNSVYRPAMPQAAPGGYQTMQSDDTNVEVSASAALRRAASTAPRAAAPAASSAYAPATAPAMSASQSQAPATPSARSILEGSYPVEMHDGNVIYAVDVDKAGFRAKGANKFPDKLGKLEDEMTVIVGFDDDFDVYEILIDKEKWMEREEHLGQFERAITLESHEGTLTEVALAEETGAANPFSVTINDSIGIADGFMSMAAMELSNTEMETEFKLTKFELTRPIPAVAIPISILKEFTEAVVKVEETKDSDEPLYFTNVAMKLLDDLKTIGNTAMVTFLDDIVTRIVLTAIRYRVSDPAPNATLSSFYESKDDVVEWAVGRDINIELFNCLEEELPKYFNLLNEVDKEDDDDDAIQSLITTQVLSPWVMAVDEDGDVPLGRITYGSYSSLYRAIDGAFAKLKDVEKTSTILVITQKGEILEILRKGGRIPYYYCIDKK